MDNREPAYDGRWLSPDQIEGPSRCLGDEPLHLGASNPRFSKGIYVVWFWSSIKPTGD